MSGGGSLFVEHNLEFPIEQDFKENVIGFARKRGCNSVCLQPGDVWWAGGHRGESFNEGGLQGNCGVDPTEGVDSFGLYARPTINDAKVKILPLIILSEWRS